MSTDRTTDEDTQYHQLPLPAYEKDPWIDDWDELVEQNIDPNLKLSDTIANRPSTSNAPDDAWYEATDENIVYRNDSASGWIKVATKDHNDLDNISSDDHHSKTNSASELTDVSPDSVSDAHHNKTTSQNDLTDFHFDGERIDVQSTEPSNPTTNDLWLDTS